MILNSVGCHKLQEDTELLQESHWPQVLRCRSSGSGFRLVDTSFSLYFFLKAELANFHVPAVEMEDGTVGFKVVHNGEQRQLSVVQLLASLLGHLKTNVDQNINSKVVDCVVGVPVFFNDAQRHAFLDATRIANLNCLRYYGSFMLCVLLMYFRLLNETSAVALAYGIYKQDLPAEEEPARRVIFVDFGHNSLQVL